MLLWSIKVIGYVYCWLRSYFNFYAMDNDTTLTVNQRGFSRSKTMKRIYLSLVRHRLGIYQDIGKSDYIVQKAICVAEMVKQEASWPWLLAGPHTDNMDALYETVQRDNSPTHIVICLYYAIEVEVHRSRLDATNYRSWFPVLVPNHIGHCDWDSWAREI